MMSLNTLAPVRFQYTANRPGFRQQPSRVQFPTPIQPLLVKGRFRNNGEGHPFRHQIQAFCIAWKTLCENLKRLFVKSAAYGTVPPALSLKPYPINPGLSTHWVGHATSLIQMGGFNILTDPIFGDLGGLYKRKSQLGIRPSHLPPIDAVVISHTHRDHLDIPSLRQLLEKGALRPDTLIVAPAGTLRLFQKLGFSNVKTFHQWWEPIKLTKSTLPGRTLNITPVATRHWSGRNGFDTNKSLWAGFVFQAGDKTAYFPGDSAYDEKYFTEIHARFPKIDLALMPIGPCEPRALMEHSHMDPAEVVKALKILKPSQTTAVHYATYGLGADQYKTPIQRLNQEWARAKNDPVLEHTQFTLLPIGGRLDA